MLDTFQGVSRENPSQVDSIMGAVVKASIDEYIKEVRGLQERELFPNVSFGDIAMTDPEYREVDAKQTALEEELKKILPEDAYGLLDDYTDAIQDEMTYEVNYSYKHGFIDGVAHSQIPVRWAQDIGKTAPATKQEKGQRNQGKYDEIVKAILGAAPIPSAAKTLRDTLRSFICDRLHSCAVWYPFSFITEEAHRETEENIKDLYRKLLEIPSEYKKIAIEYVEEVDGAQGFKLDDAYMKGIIDGMEIQRLLQGGDSR